MNIIRRAVARWLYNHRRPARRLPSWPRRPFVGMFEERLLPSTYTVTNTNDSGAGSLRQAILDVNGDATPDVIDFSIGGGGQAVISPLSALPTITNSVTIDGTSQPGYSGAPLIVLNGASAGNGATGLAVSAGNTTIEALVVDGFKGFGIELTGAGGDLVVGCYIGTDATGTTAVGNLNEALDIASDSNTIGGTTASARNIISGGGFDGIALDGSNCVIEGNYVGTDVSGTSTLGNAGIGIIVNGTNNTIGGITSGAGNLISGNGEWGVIGGGTNAVIAGNFVGTDATGTTALGNGRDGVEITNTGSGNTIGGNLISGNTLSGVRITNAAGAGNVVAGNLIGTTAAGTGALANAEGVYVASTSNTIGGTSAGARNVIAGNTGDGIQITGTGTTSDVVEGNYIGVDSTGFTALANGGDGIEVDTAGNSIGAASAGNVISGNALVGVHIVGNANLVQGNLIGTDADGLVARPNDMGVQIAGGAAGNLIGTNGDGVSDAAERNVISGNGEYGIEITGANDNTIAGNYIGTNAAGTGAIPNPDGIALFAATGNVIGTDGSDAVNADARNIISGNSGRGIVLSDANLVAGNWIGLDVNGAALGNQYGIQVTEVGGQIGGVADPAERNVISANTLDGIFIRNAGTTGALVVGNYIGTDPTGTLARPNGVGISIGVGANGNTIGGTTSNARNVISGNSDDGVDIQDSGTINNLIEGNFIGTDVTGTFALPNSSDGVRLGSSTSGNTIGGTGAGAGNVISGNSGNGVTITDSGTTGNLVEGNYVGTDAAGTAALANGNIGILIDTGADGNTVGGLGIGAKNVISGNASNGVQLNSNNNVVLVNFIGIDQTGTAKLANAGSGVDVGGSDNTIGGVTPGSANVIAGNGVYGLAIHGGTGTQILGNFIGTNLSSAPGLGNGNDGVLLFNSTGNNTIDGNFISGNAGNGVEIDSTAGTGTLIQGNRIGTNVGGTGALGNSGTGISIASGNNTIGGISAAARNIISGNTSAGVYLTGSSATNNLVEGNYIGTNAAGTAALGNGTRGVDIQSADSNSVLGNVISANGNTGIVAFTSNGTDIENNEIGTNAAGTAGLGNAGRGIYIQGTTVFTITGTMLIGNLISANGFTANASGIRLDYDSGTLVQGNKIGTDVTGAVALGNDLDGLRLLSSQNDTIGGIASTTGNLISGNGNYAISLEGTTGILVEGNRIGTNAAGTNALGNGTGGIFIHVAASGNTIGGTAAGAGNVISGNAGEGVRIAESGTTANVIAGNLIGTNAAGTGALANQGDGVFVVAGAQDNQIGGPATGDPTAYANVIAYNTGAGVAIGASPTDTTTLNNDVRGNSIFANGGLGIDLGSRSQVTANDTFAAGPNNFQTFPVLTHIAAGSTTEIAGTLQSVPSMTYTLDFYANPAPDPSGYGPGKRYLGFTTVTTDETGFASFDVILGTATTSSDFISATATDPPGGNTSEFGQTLQAETLPVVTINGPSQMQVGLSVPFRPTITDPDTGKTYTYAWSVSYNGNPLTLPDPAVVANNPSTDETFIFDPQQPGTYQLAVTVSDNLGGVVTSTATVVVTGAALGVTITGNPPGTPAPITAAVSQFVTFDGLVADPLITAAGGSTPANIVFTYAWSVSKDGQPFALPAGTITNASTFTFAPSGSGIYTIGLSVSDGQGSAGSTNTILIASSGAPVAQIVPQPGRQVAEGTPVTLQTVIQSGVLSRQLTFHWTITPNNGQPIVTETDTTGTFTFNPREEGQYVVSLGIADDQGHTGSANAITITASEATPALTLSGAPLHSNAGQALTVTGAASDADPNLPGSGSADTYTLSWHVTSTGGSAIITSGSGSSFTFTPSGTALFFVTLTATDEAGYSTSTTRIISVTQVIDPLTLTPPTNPTEGQALTWAAHVTAPIGVTFTYSWQVTDPNNGTTTYNTGSSNTLTLPAPALPGQYAVSVVATGSDGSLGSASPPAAGTLVTVANVAPGVSILVPAPPAPRISFQEGDTIRLGSTVTDPGSDLAFATYAWTVTGPDGFVAHGFLPNLEIMPTEVGVYTATLAVSDSNNGTGTATTTIAVTHLPPQPTVKLVNVRSDGSLNLTVQVPDPGSDDVFTYSVALNGSLYIQPTPGGNRYAFRIPAITQTTAVAVTVSDDDGGGPVTVITTILSEPSGVNKSLTSADLVPGATAILVLAQGNNVIDAGGLPANVTAVLAAVGGHNTLKGGPGVNIFQGDSGSNLLDGGSGSNTYFASGSDSVVGGTGTNDVVPMVATTTGNTLSITAGSGANTIDLSQQSGVSLNLAVTGSAQTFDALGNQVLLSGSFQSVLGSAGNDTLTAGSGSNILAGAGNDSLLSGGGANVTLMGGSGSDTLQASGGSNVLLLAGSGLSTLSAMGVTNATLVGGSGSNDSLSAGGGSNISLVGGSGSGTVLTSLGNINSTLFGGSGSNDSILGGLGDVNVMLYGGSGSNDSILGGMNSSNVSLTGGSGSNDSVLGGQGMQNVTLTGGSGSNDSIIGGQGNINVSLTGGSGSNDSILGGAGSSNVTLTGGSGSNDSIVGGTSSHNVSLTGGSGSNDSILGGFGSTNVTLTGGSGSNDSIVGGLNQQNVSLTGGSGSNDSILGGAGSQNVSLTGGSGSNDSVISGPGSSNVSLAGGSGSNDSVIGGMGSTNVSLVGGSGSNDSVIGGPSSSNVSLTGGSGSNDSILGGANSNNVSLTGGSGSNDSILGGAGSNNVTLTGGSGSNDSIIGGLGSSNVSLTGGSGSNDSVIGGMGSSNVSLTGGSGSNDSILGGANSNNVSLTGGSGSNDSILGGAGSNNVTLTGGSGSNDSIIGGLGSSNVSLTGGSGSNDSILGGANSNNVSLTGGSGSNDSVVGGIGSHNVSLTGGSGSNDSVIGGAGSNNVSLTGGSGSNDSILGGSGSTNVSLVGGSGSNDSLVSGANSQNVWLIGGSGSNDSLVASNDQDVILIGGSGSNDSLVATNDNTATLWGYTGPSARLSANNSTNVLMVGGSGSNDSILSGPGNINVSLTGGSGSNDSLGTIGDTNVSLTGGSGSNDSIVAGPGSQNVTLVGGSGNNDFLSATADYNLILVGGLADNDVLLSSANQNVTLWGGVGSDNDILISSGDTNAVLFGGTGNFQSLNASNDTNASLIGGSGGLDSLTSTGGTGITLIDGGPFLDYLVSNGGTNVGLYGGSGANSLTANGGTNVGLFGEGVDNSYYVTGTAANPFSGFLDCLSTTSLVQSPSDQQTAGTNTIAFPTATNLTLDLSQQSGGAAVVIFPQSVTSNVALNLVGLFNNVIGTAGNDYIKGNALANSLVGGAGNDTLVAGSGDATLVAGAGNDSLVGGSGNDTYQFIGTDSMNVIINQPSPNNHDTVDLSQLGGSGPVTLNLASTAVQAVNSNLTLTFVVADAQSIIGSPRGNTLTGNSRANFFTLSGGTNQLTGGGGFDTYNFTGGTFGSNSIANDGSTNALNFHQFVGPVHINLGQSSQTVGDGTLSVNPQAVVDVVGSTFGGSIVGNPAAGAPNESLYGGGGAASLVAGSGNDLLQANAPQVVLLDFDSWTSLGAANHVYTQDERAAIQERIESVYAAFISSSAYGFSGLIFTQSAATAESLAQSTGGGYYTLFFNKPPEGGLSDMVNFRHVNMRGSASIDASLILGQPNQPAATTANWIAETAGLAVHELGHLYGGLRHADSFGPIGTGVYEVFDPNGQQISGVDPSLFVPVFQEPAGVTPVSKAFASIPGTTPITATVYAPETPLHVMASPASVGISRFDTLNDIFFGEREAIRLAFADTGATILAQSTPHASFAAAEALGTLPGLTVPNTLLSGANYGKTFDVSAIDVVGHIGIDPNTGQSANDYYSFAGHQGQLMEFEVDSNVLFSRINAPIDSTLSVYDSSGNLIAFNDDEFESRDSRLFDVTLPADGQYYVKVSTFAAPNTINTSTGDYELFMYSFVTGGPSPSSGSTLVAGAGQDTLIGSTGNDLFRFTPQSTGATTIMGGNGSDVVDEQAAPNANVYIVPPTPPSTITILSGTDTTTPTFQSLAAQSVNKGNLLQFTALATDDPGDLLTYSLEAVPGSANPFPTGASINRSTGDFNWNAGDEGTYAARLLATDAGGNVGYEDITITVVDVAPAVNALASQTVDEGSAVSMQGSIANPVFTDTYTYTWTVTLGTQTVASGTGSTFTFTPGDDGTYSLALTVLDNEDGKSTTVQTTITVNDVAPTVAPMANQAVFAGTTVTLSGSYTDPGTVDSQILTWSVVSNNGDVIAGGSGSSFTFTPGDQGIYTVTFTVQDADGGPAASTTATITAFDVAPTAVLPASVSLLEGQSTSISFTNPFDPAARVTAAGFGYSFALDPSGLATSYSGSSSSPTVTFTGAEEGTYTIYGRIFDKNNSYTDYSTGVTVTDAPLAVTGGYTVASAESSSTGTQTVATFTDPGSVEPLSDYTATIAWGDGATSTGTITLAGGVFTVSGGHTYAEEGNYPINVTLTHDQLPSVTVSSTASVSEVALSATGGYTLTATEGTASALQTVATFTDPAGAEPLDNYAVTINWGDGLQSAGIITFASGTFTVQGSHLYADEGSWPISVTILHKSAAPLTVASTATVSDPAVLAVGRNIAVAEGAATGQVVVATFTDPGGAEAASTYSATIDWGDGNTSSGAAVSIVLGSDGQTFEVLGDHTYAVYGSYPLTVTISHGSAASARGTATAAVSDPAVVGTGGFTFFDSLGLLSATQPVATFTDPGGPEDVSHYSATIAWPDGTTSAGTITYSSGVFTVSASHTFLQVGTGTITVTLNHDIAPSAVVTDQSIVVPSIMVLDPTLSGALTLSGNATISSMGAVVVDSSSTSALQVSGNAQITASSIEVVGGVSKSGTGTLSPAPTPTGRIADPFAALAVPMATTLGLTNQGAVNLTGSSSLTISPGIYSRISVSSRASLTLQPGIYIVTGGGITVSGYGSITGNGVMLFNAGTGYNPATGSDGGTYGSINLSGNGTYSLSAATSGTYAGILVFQDRNNTRAITLSGNSLLAASGIIYAPQAALTLSGKAQGGTSTVSFVVDRMTLSANATADALGTPASGTVAYSPAQIRAAYGINNLSVDGTGQTIAIVDAYDDPSIYQALDTFDTEFGLTSSGPSLYQLYGPASGFLTVLSQDGQTTDLPATDPNGPGTANWEVEAALDVEWVHAIAPGAQIILVETNSQALADLMAGVATAASQPGVSVVSMSWGFVEGQAVVQSDEAAYDSDLTHPGVTFVASTGDYGAAEPQYPAFSPNVLAVGGTTLTLNADNSYNSEAGWGYNDAALGAFIGSGGGISQYESEPTYQEGVQSTGNRTTPDVSFLADPNTGAWIADPYNLDPANPFEVAGGTSLSAPAWAGLIALTNEGRAVAGEQPLNSASATDAQHALYSLPQTDYHVINSGYNGYTAGPGYNLVTGLGTPLADHVISDLVAWSGTSNYSGATVAPIQSSSLVYTGGDGSSSGGTINVFTALTLSGLRGTDTPPAAQPTVPAANHNTEMQPVLERSDAASAVSMPLAIVPNPTSGRPAFEKVVFASGYTGMVGFAWDEMAHDAHNDAPLAALLSDWQANAGSAALLAGLEHTHATETNAVDMPVWDLAIIDNSTTGSASDAPGLDSLDWFFATFRRDEATTTD